MDHANELKVQTDELRGVIAKLDTLIVGRARMERAAPSYRALPSRNER
jgi:hypothetical protein